MTSELVNFDGGGVSVIFGGIDPTGAHLYVAHNAEVSCADGVGYAAIGSGSYHARSQMMFAGHTASSTLTMGLAALYMAKKRAEVAPGVGAETDSVVVLEIGQIDDVHHEALSALSSACDAEIQKIAAGFATVEQQLNETIKRINEGRQQQPPQEQTADG